MAHQSVTETSSQPVLKGLSGVKRTSNNAAKQIVGTSGPSKPGSDSPKGRPTNASFDSSPYQNIVKSMVGGK